MYFNPNRNIMNKVNTVIKTLSAGSSEKELHETLDTVWKKYKNFNHDNDPFENDECICSIKDICDDNSFLWNQKYCVPSTKVIGF